MFPESSWEGEEERKEKEVARKWGCPDCSPTGGCGGPQIE